MNSAHFEMEQLVYGNCRCGKYMELENKKTCLKYTGLPNSCTAICSERQ